MQTISIIIPSRTQPDQEKFLNRALASIQWQTTYRDLSIDLIIGIDLGTKPPKDLRPLSRIRFVESDGRFQAKALNACIRSAAGEYIAFLEDDDEFEPKYLQTALAALASADFVSSTSLEVNKNGQIVRISDFPAPSGWLMRSSTLRAVGEFNEAYRFHLDNEWLGRLAEAKLKRIHLVESTAPTTVESAWYLRQCLADVFCLGGEAVRFLRHDSPFPLVRRLVHPISGMSQIATNPECAEVSKLEVAWLKERFGRIPS